MDERHLPLASPSGQKTMMLGLYAVLGMHGGAALLPSAPRPRVIRLGRGEDAPELELPPPPKMFRTDVIPRGEVYSSVPVPGAPKQGRNDACACGSGRKHKKCCMVGARVLVAKAVAAPESAPS